MADDKDKKISQFDLEATLDGDEIVPIVKGGVNYKTTLADVRGGLATEERVKAIEDAQAQDLKEITRIAGVLNGVDNVQEALDEKQPIGNYATRSELGDYATRNELDVVETLAESVNRGLGETIQRVDTLETSLQADKTNLANFKAHVEADFVKDADYNNDKGTIMGEIMKCAKTTYVDAQDKATLSSAKSYTDTAINNELNASAGQLEVLNELAARLADDSDIAATITRQLAEISARLTALEEYVKINDDENELIFGTLIND